MTELRRGRGRPRNVETDRAIMQASWVVLAEKGYDGMTFEAVAEIVGCSRTTLYRRFASKAEMVESMLFETSRQVEPQLREDEDPRAALIAHASALALFIDGGRGKAMLSLVDSAARTPELREATIRHMEAEREYYYDAFRKLAEDAPTDDSLSFAFDTLIGSIFYQIAMRDKIVSPQQIERLVDSSIRLLTSD